MTVSWKKGRGKLGPLTPLLGSWEARADSPRGPLKCTRTFAAVLDGKYIQLKCTWQFSNSSYEEIALFGVEEGELRFWSFTSDGKRSSGVLASAPEVHEGAICFEAQVPAGVARQIYWPSAEGGMSWAVESKSKKGWHRFTEHRYTATE